MSENVAFYDIEYICMYPYVAEILIDPNINKEDLENLTYQKDLLNVFQLENIDEAEIQVRLQHLFSFCKTNHVFHTVLNKLVTSLDIPRETTTDPLYMAFYFLFSFDFLHVVHPCFCDLITSGTISEKHQNNLYDIVINKINK